MALDLLEDFPEVARTTIFQLAGLQGVRKQDRAEEEPGRILHEDRLPNDPHWAACTANWDLPYYGAVDTTPLFVILVDAYCRRYGRSILASRVPSRGGSIASISLAVKRALCWIENRIARHGYVCVQRAQPFGIVNQVWEDSCDSYYDADGRLFDPDVPYAPVAVQGYAYDALLAGAELTRDSASAAHWRALAELVRRKVLREFWLADLGTFAPALVLDGQSSRPTRVVASSPGHLLAGRLLEGPDGAPFREALSRRLAADDLLTAAGIRTKSTTAPRFRAGGYHNGSVWPMDSGVIADGLRRHGYVEQADDLDQRILIACAKVNALPEFFRGDADGGIRVNTQVVDAMVDGHRRRLEQPPQRTQGWTASRVWRLLRRRGLIALEPPGDGHEDIAT